MKKIKTVLNFRLFILLAVGLACTGLPGCLGLSVSELDKGSSGPAGQHAVVERIQPGQTKEFILGLLGEPGEKTPGEAGVEVWQWSYTENRTDFNGFIFLYGSLTETKVEKARYVEFKDGVVTRTWGK